MTIYELSIISTSGFPYYNKILKPIPKGVKVFLRFFDFSKIIGENPPNDSAELMFDLKAGLISALFEFARNIDKRIKILEFKTKSSKEQNNISNENEINSKGDLLITVTTESYLLHNQIEKKIKIIYKEFITSLIALDSACEIPNNEQSNFIDILIDKKARDHINDKEKELNKKAIKLINDMEEYGLRGIVCTSFDLSPIICFSKANKYSLQDIDEILRNIGNIPDIKAYEWVYRQSLYNNKPIWIFIINSGAGVTVKDIFESYYYLLLAEPNSYIG
ncbi:MAG: hypothetical protein KGD57_05495, partial [Candidatus Lokiarchaeota archaeon]|nr:hypothetical protein [Candidatus Lokiarchaeota archaeon]